MATLNYSQLCTSEPLIAKSDEKKLTQDQLNLLTSGGIIVELPRDVQRALYLNGAKEKALPLPRILYLEGSEKFPFTMFGDVSIDLDKATESGISEKLSYLDETMYVPADGYEIQPITPTKDIGFSKFGLSEGMLRGNQVGTKRYYFSCNAEKNAMHTDDSGTRGFLVDDMATTIRVGPNIRCGRVINHMLSVHLDGDTFLDVFKPHSPHFVKNPTFYTEKHGYQLTELSEGLDKVLQGPEAYKALADYLLGE